MFKSILKKVSIAILVIVGLLILAYVLFTSFYPSFGGDISDERQVVYQKSKQFREGKFNNTKPVPKDLSLSETLKLAYFFFTTEVVNGEPKEDLKVTKLNAKKTAGYDNETRLVWFGHSSFLLQIEGKNILLDPMFGQVAAPHPLLGSNRFNKEFPLELDQLPPIDAVVFSHDHYDHLDYETVIALKGKTKHFYVPLGVGAHLEAWGISENKISEMDWWQETKMDQLTLVCTPAQHFSGRKLNNGQSTLWSSWVIQSEKDRIYFSGDSGYATHFKEIGNKFGPFDIAMMECGQYNEKWSDIHMMPEETAQAGLDLQAKKIIPIHWAGFKLALHSWTEPVERVKLKATELDVTVITPEIGQEIMVKDSVTTYANWWEGL